MLAAVMRSLGELPCVEDVPEPTPGEGQEVVRVTACPLTNLDRARASGNHPAAPTALPAVCGAIAVGTLPDGARVLFRSPAGAMAERAVTRREWCSLIPDGVDDALAAAIQNPGVSAWNVFEWRAKLRPGERVLILGATGVAGQGGRTQSARAGLARRSRGRRDHPARSARRRAARRHVRGGR